MNAQRFILLLFGGFLLSILQASADKPREIMSRGLQAYEKGDFEAARQAFEQAARAAKDTRLDPGIAHFNEANALLRLGEADRAASIYMDALRSTDLSLQAKAFFNRGNALYHLAEYAQSAGDLDTALQALEQALAMYENAMALDTRDRDSKINYELTLHKQEQVKELQEQQQQQQEGEQEDEEDQDKDKEGDQQPDDQSDPSDQPEQPEPDTADDSSEQQQDQPQETQEEPSADEMTPEEARVMLDAMRQEEQAARERYRMVHGTPGPVDKDW